MSTLGLFCSKEALQNRLSSVALSGGGLLRSLCILGRRGSGSRGGRGRGRGRRRRRRRGGGRISRRGKTECLREGFEWAEVELGDARDVGVEGENVGSALNGSDDLRREEGA